MTREVIDSATWYSAPLVIQNEPCGNIAHALREIMFTFTYMRRAACSGLSNFQRGGVVWPLASRKRCSGVPWISQLYDLVEETRARMAPHGALVSGFGHLGDGNLHLNVCTPGAFDADAAVAAAIEPWVFEYIAERRGSISAEHGVGVMKPHVLHLSKRPPVIGVMHALKRLLDPHGILNPGKVLPPPPEEERPWRSAS